MLVLSRKVGEKIIIDGGIVIEVISIEGNRVKIGILAPGEVTILRAELLLPPSSDPQGPSIAD